MIMKIATTNKQARGNAKLAAFAETAENIICLLPILSDLHYVSKMKAPNNWGHGHKRSATVFYNIVFCRVTPDPLWSPC
jgi:hypothetical protein